MNATDFHHYECEVCGWSTTVAGGVYPPADIMKPGPCPSCGFNALRAFDCFGQSERCAGHPMTVTTARFGDGYEQRAISGADAPDENPWKKETLNLPKQMELMRKARDKALRMVKEAEGRAAAAPATETPAPIKRPRRKLRLEE